MAKQQATKAHCRKVMKEVMNIINQSSNNVYAESFRDIITALRGPDTDDTELKSNTTMWIRGMAGMSWDGSGLLVNGRAAVTQAHLEKVLQGSRAPGALYHFADHIRRAVDGIKVLYSNQLK